MFTSIVRRYFVKSGEIFYAYTVGGFLFQKQMLKNGRQYHGHQEYYRGIRVGIEIGRRIERQVGKQNGTE